MEAIVFFFYCLVATVWTALQRQSAGLYDNYRGVVKTEYCSCSLLLHKGSC